MQVDQDYKPELVVFLLQKEQEFDETGEMELVLSKKLVLPRLMKQQKIQIMMSLMKLLTDEEDNLAAVLGCHPK